MKPNPEPTCRAGYRSEGSVNGSAPTGWGTGGKAGGEVILTRWLRLEQTRDPWYELTNSREQLHGGARGSRTLSRRDCFRLILEAGLLCTSPGALGFWHTLIWSKKADNAEQFFPRDFYSGRLGYGTIYNVVAGLWFGNAPDHDLGLGTCHVRHPSRNLVGPQLFALLLLEMTAC